MLSLKKKDVKARSIFSKYELRSRVVKLLLTNLASRHNYLQGSKFLPLNLYKLQTKFRRCSKVKIRTRCVLTNRGRGIYRPYGLSRIVLREFMQFGIIPGYKKAVF
jgi:ribosomal protein S14